MTGKDWNYDLYNRIWQQVWETLENCSPSLTYLLREPIGRGATPRVKKQVGYIWDWEKETTRLKSAIMGEVSLSLQEQGREDHAEQ